jgi:hypothetical protein
MRRQDLKDFGLRRQTEVSSFENKLALVSSCEQDFEPKVSEYLILLRFMTLQPNKSPEPTAVGAGSSAVAVHVASRRWLSFFR